MADEKISALPAAGTLDGTEPVPVVKAGVTKQTTTQSIADLATPTTPTLQQVTDVGNDTTNDFRSNDGAGSRTVIGNGIIEITTGAAGTVTIDASQATALYTAQLPNKAAASVETFAMLSDIPSGVGDMMLASAQTNTGLKTFLDGSFGLRNIANTITSFFSTAATVARTWTLQDADGTLAFTSDITVTPTSTNTLTNKRITARTGTTTSSATPTINTDNVDFYSLTAQTVDITSFTTNLSGTPTEGQTLWIAITGTAARAITWGSSFEASTIALPTTTVTTNRLDVAFIWNSISSKWRCVGSV